MSSSVVCQSYCSQVSRNSKVNEMIKQKKNNKIVIDNNLLVSRCVRLVGSFCSVGSVIHFLVCYQRLGYQ